jgi:4-amino-4-deoxychorismate lyase
MVDGRFAETLPADDRGLLYGDGLFETLRVVQGRAPLWPRHMRRLKDGCARLGLPPPDAERLRDEAAQVAGDLDAAVVRITWTRGSGPRGYRPPHDAQARRVMTAAPAPRTPVDWSDHGIRIRCCRTRMASQPALAGLKHLNRLEQVLARGEWDDPDLAEGLMRDMHGRVVCATAANLFARIDGQWITPPVDTCGVAGVARAEVLAQWPDCRIATIEMDALMQAEEIFLSSSVRGILPVRELDGRALPVGDDSRLVQAHFDALLELRA